jgi:hypothetical protein
MNLLAKSFGQLAMLAVALFFFSCEDPTSIGIENPSPKFDLHFVDIPLESSVILMDTLRTGNVSADLSRFVVGKYSDPEFGNVQASFFSEYLPGGLVELKNSPVFNDTVILELAFDYYTYGSSTSSEQTISVYKLTEDINGSSVSKLTEFAKGYWRKNSNSEVPYDPAPLGSQSFMVDPAAFADLLKKNDDTPLTMQIPLPVDFGRQLFDEIVKYKTVTDDVETKGVNEKFIADSAFVVNFREIFKGLAVKADVADKIVRFIPGQSAIKLYYGNSTATGKYLRYYFSLGGVPSFSQITSERAGELASVTEPGTAYLQDSPNRYIQSGVGIFTKVDLTNFYKFADTIPAAIINEAQFIISDVAASEFTPPSALGFRVIENNREVFADAKNPQHVLDSAAYGGYLRIDKVGEIAMQADRAFYFVNDRGSTPLDYSTEKKMYSGYVTMLTQQLFKKGDGRSKFNSIVLYPVSPKASKSVNRVMFPADKIKLRIHYTIPTNINH